MSSRCRLPSTGQIGTCEDDGGRGINGKIRKTLIEVAQGRAGSPLRLVSLAQIGARPGTGEKPWGGRDQIKEALTKTLGRGKVQMKPWAGLAIGVQAWDLAEAGEALDSGTVLALQAATKDCRRPADIGAYALGLGMSKTVDAIPTLVEKLDFFTGSTSAATAAWPSA